VFALRSGRHGKPGALASVFGVSAFSLRGFVLPWWLRRPVRLFSRVLDEDFQPPRFAVLIGSVACIGLFSFYGAILGGHMPSVLQAVTSRLGFAVDNVKISGYRETSEIDILDRIGLDGWTSLVGFDAEAARGRVADLPWIETASVRKIYPDTIEVVVTERTPFALWQHGNQISVIEASGNVIAPFSNGRHARLPLVIGLGAKEQAAEFIDQVKTHPELAARVKGYIRVAERRWDLRLENGVTIKLPESNEDAAINELLAMEAENGLLARDIETVDLRFTDRVVVQLSPAAAERRAAEMDDLRKTVAARKGKRT
jgi:cell division protein FtsQ